MSNAGQRVYLYIFDANDGVATEEKLRSAARRFLSSRGETAEELTIARTERGKPYFADYPRLYGSPSHSGDYCVCAMADFPVGADIQIHSRLRSETPEEAAVRLKRIARRYFSPAEAEFVETDTCDRFFRLWTARESYVKLTGQGIDGDFAEHCVLPEGVGAIPAGDGAGWQALGAVFRQMRLPGPYTVCVCARKDFSLEVIRLTEGL